MKETDKPQEKDSTGTDEIDSFLMMEEIIEKLKLLDYEALFTRVKGHPPLPRTYFACKAQNAGEQPVYFNSLSIWLLSQCGGQISAEKKYEDPVTMANNLLTEMKNIGINCDIPPNKLRTGYGESVCVVLLQLIDRALEKKKLSFKKPRFEEQKTSGSDNGPDIEEESPDLINTEIDYGDKQNQEDGNIFEKDVYEVNKGTGASNILYSDIPPEEWQRELEKVSSKLKLDYNNISAFGSSEWRSHIEQIRENEQKFVKSIPDSRGILENLSGEIDKSLEKITKKEEIISKSFTNIIHDYKERHQITTNQFDEYKQLSEIVENMKRELDEIQDKITKANEKYEEISKSISDTSSVANAKQAIQKLQNEAVSMDMKIHILNHSILKYQQFSHNYRQNNGEGFDASMFEDVI